MFSRLFDSISFPLIAFIFFIFVSLMYFVNKKYNSYANKTYRVLLFFTLTTSLTLFFDFFGTDGVPVFKGLEPIFARLYILSTMLWASTYSYYLIIKLFIKEENKKTYRLLKIIVYGFNILLFIWSCFLDLEFQHRTIYAIGGKALTPLYVEFAVTGAVYLLSLILKHKLMNKTQIIMHSMVLIILIIMTIFRFYTSWDVNYFTYVICIVPIVLYFSSESSAFLLGKELEVSNANLTKLNQEQNKLLDKLSINLKEPLDNILYSQELINNNELSDEEFNNEKIKIYNEIYKIYNLVNQISQDQSEVKKQ